MSLRCLATLKRETRWRWKAARPLSEAIVETSAGLLLGFLWYLGIAAELL